MSLRGISVQNQDESARELLRKSIERDITPLDVIAGILFHFEDNATFTTNYEKLHRAFYAVKNYPLLKEFKFLERGVYPYSELLESVFSRLAISGLLSCLNPDYRQYTLNNDQRERIRIGILKKFDPRQMEELKSIGQEILSNLG